MARRLPIDADHPAYDPSSCGPDGLPQCRRCMREIRVRRSDGFCSDACRHESQLRTSASYVRHALFARDRGICTHCRTDCALLDRVIRHIARSGIVGDSTEDQEPGSSSGSTGYEVALRTLEALGFGKRRRIISLWQADHRIAIAEGGRDCGLGNYRTLCLNCHAVQTKHLHRRLREARA